MTELATVDLATGEIMNFEPQATVRKLAQADAVIEYAQRVKNWPALEPRDLPSSRSVCVACARASGIFF